MINIRTDLAIEAAAIYNKTDEDIKKIEGVDVSTEVIEDIKITHVAITNKNGEKTVGKKIGNYITIESPKIRDGSEENFDLTVKVLTEKLNSILKLKPNSTILTVGLGNWNVTPDALGPKVISNLSVTRHLFEFVPEAIDSKKTFSMCAVSPGVLGITGIETSEIIKGITEMVKPDVIIAIDALASRKTDRISTTIQLADTGITPGSGVGNKRKGLDIEYLGVPVIAIGVPTVVDAATVANDAMELLFKNISEFSSNPTLKNVAESFDSSLRYSLIKEVLTPYVGNLIVTPKEVDEIIEDVSKIIAQGINNVILQENE